jgi:hypothetical protein
VPASTALGALPELDEQPSLPRPTTERKAEVASYSPKQVPSTPAASSAVRPPFAEMHPAHAHQTMAPPSSGLRLGFTDIRPFDSNPDQPPGTPTKLPSSPFNFRSLPTNEAGLSSRAQQVKDEIREDAARIKANLQAARDKELAEMVALNGRRIAKAKGKSGRFSAAHMVEFKKMDSIAGHASAFRAVPGKFTPVTTGLKRSSSKANLDDVSSVTVRSGLKRSPSKAKLDEPEMRHPKAQAAIGSPTKGKAQPEDDPPSPAKRFKKHLNDDAASSRPVSRDDSSIPRPKSRGNDVAPVTIPRSHTTSSLWMSPTKASAAKAAAAKAAAEKPTISLMKSPSRPDPASEAKASAGNLKKSATSNNINAGGAVPGRRILSPRFERMKSLLRGHKSVFQAANAAPTIPTMSLTPAPARAEKPLPPIPATTPRRKLVKRVNFSPDLQAALKSQNSPSAVKSGIPKSKSLRSMVAEVQYPTLDTVMAGDESGTVSYPDLSQLLAKSPDKEHGSQGKSFLPPSVPSTFTFRTDHTICFGSSSPSGFGGSPGQSSVRQVRPSMLPMPGSFPASFMDSQKVKENKENKAPLMILPGIGHGLENKKRHRPSTDEEDAEMEAAARAAKKRKNEHVPEGDALLAPRLIASASAKKKVQIPRPVGGSSPSKKRPVLSLSRLNMLARPRHRQ